MTTDKEAPASADVNEEPEAQAKEPKAEAKAKAKAEEPKANAKAEEPKANAKAEEPKAEEPKANAKAEEPKANAKAEEPKANANEPDAKAEDDVAADEAAAETAEPKASVGAVPAPADSQEVSKVARLERLTRDSFPGVEALELLEVAHGYVAALRVSDKLDEKGRLALGRALVELFAGQGLVVEPLLYRPAEWQQLEKLGGRRWRALITETGRAAELHELYRSARPYPHDFRQLLLSSARGYLTFIELILREAPFDLHLLASLTADVLGDALRLLFASRGRHFDGGPQAMAVFESEFVAGGAFSADQLALYFQLRALARQTRHYHDLGAPTPDARFDWEPLAERVRAFFFAFERYAYARFSTAAERSRRRVLRIAVPSAIVIVAVVAFVWVYATLRPLTPVAPATAHRDQQGGIVGRYFKGMHFDKQVRERVDSMINIHTTGAPEPLAGSDGFSVRWEGYLRFLKDDRHAVCLDSDDGARLWLGGKLVVDAWKKHRLKKSCSNVRVKRGWYPIKVEYYDEKGLAAVRLKVGLEARHAKLVRPVDLCCRPKTPPKPRPAIKPKPAGKVLTPARLVPAVKMPPKLLPVRPGQTPPTAAGRTPAPPKKPAPKKPAPKKPAPKKPAPK